jgi:hypothetical protein
MSAAHAFMVPVRVTHLFTCLAALAFTGWVLAQVPHMFATNSPHERGPDFELLGWTAIIVLFFGAPALRALWRVARRRPLVDDAQIPRRPVFWTLATLASLLAHFIVANVAYAVWTSYPDFDGNAAGPLLLAALLYAFALVGGELVLLWPIDAPALGRDAARLFR